MARLERSSPGLHMWFRRKERSRSRESRFSACISPLTCLGERSAGNEGDVCPRVVVTPVYDEEPPAAFASARTDRERGNLDAALSGFERFVLEQGSAPLDVAIPFGAAARFEIAAIYDQKGDVKQALSAYDTALDYYARNEQALGDRWNDLVQGARKRQDWLRAKRRRERRAWPIAIALYGSLAALIPLLHRHIRKRV
jgi:tetratricopeptide (TPR) repeat protein